MDEEIIRELLDTNDFYKTMIKNKLYKYELLDLMRNNIFVSDSSIKMQEKEILKEIYRVEGCMFDINYDPVMFISDTHYDYSSLDRQDMNRWDFLYYVLDFCKYNKIRYLVHGGDIGDGTIEVNGVKQFIDFGRGSYENTREQINNILKNYLVSPEAHHLVLGGNHDKMYLSHNIDILRELADKKNVLPLGYCQAFFSVFGCPISLEHENRSFRIECRNLIPHSLTIHGHSHIAKFNDYDIYIPTLGGFLNHKGEEGGEPGFIVMYPYNGRNSVHLEFDHYYLKDGCFEKKPESYVYKLNKK